MNIWRRQAQVRLPRCAPRKSSCGASIRIRTTGRRSWLSGGPEAGCYVTTGANRQRCSHDRGYTSMRKQKSIRSRVLKCGTVAALIAVLVLGALPGSALAKGSAATSHPPLTHVMDGQGD